MGLCAFCSAKTPYLCKCPFCKPDILKTQVYYCSAVCRVSDKAKHEINRSQQLSQVASSTSSQIIYQSWQKGNSSMNIAGDNPAPERSLSQNTLSGPESSPSTSSPLSKILGHGQGQASKRRSEASSGPVSGSRRKKSPGRSTSKKSRRETPVTKTIEHKEKRRNAKKMTTLFNKIKSKVVQMEPLTPTWHWTFNVEKNRENSRASKHKYASASKLADMTTKAAKSRLSRLWLQCVGLCKEIEKIDPNYIVVLEARKPENENCARLGKHRYKTNVEEEESIPLSQSSDQSESQSSNPSQASTGSAADTGVSIDCRICKEPILLDNVKEYTACLLPSGTAHFVAHYVCLGLYPKTHSARKGIKTATRCPKHNNQ